jgi:multisubunit Na+/H+ antiporter MnhF subunit
MVLLAMSLAFGLLAQLVAGGAKTAMRWLWLIAAGAFFVVGLVTSEVWFGWATEEDLQPNLDGLSFDEALLFGLLAGIASVVITRYVTRRRLRHRAKPHG